MADPFDGSLCAADSLVQLKERIDWQKAVVTLANKNARILWVILTRWRVRPRPCARDTSGAAKSGADLKSCSELDVRQADTHHRSDRR
ncbi:hypothetical protein [Pseudorhodoferax sp.]|uniref:hypothetical protein n=1 Tax=Pseudorhodoferax sp. TaxID=1993553 RepID=UPI0039E5F3C1